VSEVTKHPIPHTHKLVDIIGVTQDLIVVAVIEIREEGLSKETGDSIIGRVDLGEALDLASLTMADTEGTS
jgi:hypothetical protein